MQNDDLIGSGKILIYLLILVGTNSWPLYRLYKQSKHKKRKPRKGTLEDRKRSLIRQQSLKLKTFP
jgi:hypothetical protein